MPATAAQPVVEHAGVVDDHAVQEAAELLGVDALGAFHLAG
jgi:hypothetical protein